jgi:hypothetical protein
LTITGHPGGQCAGGIATGSGKGQRKVGRPKDHNRANGAVCQTQIRPWQRCTIRQRSLNPGVEVFVILDEVREHAQLAGRPASLTVQARFWQASLGATCLGDFIT